MRTPRLLRRWTGTRSAIGTVLAAASLAACGDLDITNTNAPTVETLTSSPTRAILARAATGIFSQMYTDVGTQIAVYALYGREGYNLNGNDPRETQEQLTGPADPTGRHSAIWLGPYQTIRTINTYLEAVPAAPGLSEAETRASLGFAKTMKAWMLHRVAIRTGDLGIPVDVDQPLGAPPAPFVSFAVALQTAIDLMDEAYDDLQAGGSSFPFPVAPGFSNGFSTPATFAEFNRALAAKMQVDRATFVNCTACWAAASSAIDASFITTSGLPESLDDGVYYAYSADASEPSNPIAEPLSSNRYWLHPSLVSGAQQRPNGAPDLRLTTKAIDAGRTVRLNDLAGTYKLILYNVDGSPGTADLGADIPWIINEELILLRAEIRWNTGNRQGAIDDINLIRVNAGGLAPTTLTASSPTEDFVTELLYNRTYSLMWTQGTRWLDARRYDRTDMLPLDRPGDIIYDNMIIPSAECDARNLPTPCQVLGS